MNSEQNLARRLVTPSEVKSRLTSIVGDLSALASDIVQAIDADPEFYARCIADGIDAHTLWRLERLGRGQIHESLVFNGRPAAAFLITLPLSCQTSALKQGIAILDWDEVTVRNFPFTDLDAQQCKQVFYRGSLRTIAEQRTWIRNKKRKDAPVEPATDFRVHKEYVVTTRPGKWSRALLLQWLSEMESA